MYKKHTFIIVIRLEGSKKRISWEPTVGNTFKDSTTSGTKSLYPLSPPWCYMKKTRSSAWLSETRFVTEKHAKRNVLRRNVVKTHLSTSQISLRLIAHAFKGPTSRAYRVDAGMLLTKLARTRSFHNFNHFISLIVRTVCSW